MSSQPTTLGQYQIIREIARSNDIVYEAYDPLMNRRVAVKELSMPAGNSAQQTEDRVSRFRREAQAVGSLNHPNIMTVYSFSEDQGRYFMAMEFLDGITLRKEIDNNGFLSVDRAIEIACDVLSGLANAHDAGVVHRDIKPDNIQLTTQNGVKITDFGIARLTFQPNLTMDGQVFGTPSYMSPEQIVGKDIDQRTDLFSVGVMLYEMISGTKPFTGDNVIAITHAVVNSQPSKPAQMPDYLWPVVQRAMEKVPHMRFHNANEMRMAIQDAKTYSQPSVPPVGGFAGGGYAPADPYGQPPSSLLNNPITPYGTPNPYLPQTAYGGVLPTSYNPYGGSPQTQGQATPPPVSYTNYNPYTAGQNVPGTSYPQGYTPPPNAYYPPPPGPPLLSAKAKETIRQVCFALALVGILAAIIIIAFINITNSISGTAAANRIIPYRAAAPRSETSENATPASVPIATDNQVVQPRQDSSGRPAEAQYRGPSPESFLERAADASTPLAKITNYENAGDAFQALKRYDEAFEAYDLAVGLMIGEQYTKSEIRKILYKMHDVSEPGSAQRQRVDEMQSAL